MDLVPICLVEILSSARSIGGRRMSALQTTIAIAVVTALFVWLLGPHSESQDDRIKPSNGTPAATTALEVKVSSGPDTTASALSLKDVGADLLAVYPQSNRALLQQRGNATLLLQVGDYHLDLGQLRSVALTDSLHSATFVNQDNRQVLTTHISSPNSEPQRLAEVAYEALQGDLNSALLGTHNSENFVSLDDQLLVLGDQYAYAGLHRGDVVRRVNQISVAQMQKIGELGSILAGGSLNIEIERNGKALTIRAEQDFGQL